MADGMHITKDQLIHRFAYHPPNNQQKKNDHASVRDVCLEAAEELVTLTGPSSREQSLAITKLEEAMFWANAALAREITAPAEAAPDEPAAAE